MAEKTIVEKLQASQKQDEHKFLGKEVAYYDGLFRLWLAIMNKVAKGEDVTNLVNHLEASFPYKDKEYERAIKKANETLRAGLRGKDKYGRRDVAKSTKAVVEFTMMKYELLMALLKRRKVLPQEAEEEWMV